MRTSARDQPCLPMVCACSSPSTTAMWPPSTALLDAMVLMAEHIVSRMPSGSFEIWLVTLCGASAAIAKTVESSAL
ncbi:hypothetical protein D3C71_1797050 [compost metagenome]